MSKCTCIADIKKGIKERVKLRDGERLETVECDGEILFSASPAKTYTEFRAYAERKSKAGNLVRRKIEQNALHKYCPFCGKEYAKEEPTHE